MKTFGIDLASDPSKTGACAITWKDGEAVVDKLWVGADDEELMSVHEQVGVTGIDAPFGWPAPFINFVAESSKRQPDEWTDERKRDLRFRRTDFRVQEITGRWPLSVSSDLIAVPAFRCAGLLERMGVTDRSGDGSVYEVYPAAALHVWGLKAKGYKGLNKRKQRRALWRGLKKKTPWLRFADEGLQELVADSDDALDALVAALVVRAAKIGLTVGPRDDEHAHARSEGWIHVPLKGSLERLL